MNPLPMTSGEHPPPSSEGRGGEEGLPSLADLFAPPAPAAAEAKAPREDPEVRRKVEAVLDELRPYIRADGGDIQLVSIDGGVVKVRLQGACQSCSASMYTLQLGVERRLREEVPEIKLVEAV